MIEQVNLRTLPWVALFVLLAYCAFRVSQYDGLRGATGWHLHFTTNQAATYTAPITSVLIPSNGLSTAPRRHVFGPLDESFVSGLKKLDAAKLLYCELTKNGT